MTTTRIKLTGPTDRDAPQFVDMTPTWAAIMPALIAALQDGTPTGQRMARGELERLAREVDGANARAREERDAAPAGQASHLKTATAALSDVLKGYAESSMRTAAAGQSDARRAVYFARASAFFHAAADARARGGNDSDNLKAEAAAVYETATAALVDAESALSGRTEERDENNAAAVTEEARAERLAAVLLDAASLLRVAVGGRASLDYGQARATIRDAESVLKVPAPSPVGPDATHVFHVRFEVPESELREYGEAWGNRPDVAPWPVDSVAQFAALLQSDLYDEQGMSGQFKVTGHATQ